MKAIKLSAAILIIPSVLHILLCLLSVNSAFGAYDGTLYGVCFSPFRQGQDPAGGNFPTEAQIEEDVVIISQTAKAIRTYGIDGTLSRIPELCHTYGVDCYPGAWVSGNPVEDQNTVSALIAIANKGYETTKALIVGNEYVYHHFSDPCSVSYITGLMNQVRTATSLPVATAEPWDVWFARSALVDAVDFIPIHHYGFLRKLNVSTSVQENINVYNEVRKISDGKEIMIFETGWPTEGETLESAVPSEANQKQFLKEFIPLAKEKNIKYFIFAGFDEPYKAIRSGIEYESHWGLYSENRTIKPGLHSLLLATRADINFDGHVNIIDFESLSRDWLKLSGSDDLCFPGDLNCDQITDLSDFTQLADTWLLSSSAE